MILKFSEINNNDKKYIKYLLKHVNVNLPTLFGGNKGIKYFRNELLGLFHVFISCNLIIIFLLYFTQPLHFVST